MNARGLACALAAALVGAAVSSGAEVRVTRVGTVGGYGIEVRVGDVVVPADSFDRFLNRVGLDEKQIAARADLEKDTAERLAQLYRAGGRTGDEWRKMRRDADKLRVEYREKALELLTDAQRRRLEAIVKVAKPPVSRPFDEVLDGLVMPDELWAKINARRAAAHAALEEVGWKPGPGGMRTGPPAAALPILKSYRSDVRKMLDAAETAALDRGILDARAFVSYLFDREIQGLELKGDQMTKLAELRQDALDATLAVRARPEYVAKSLEILTPEERKAVEAGIRKHMASTMVRSTLAPRYLRRNDLEIQKAADLKREQIEKLKAVREEIEAKLAASPGMERYYESDKKRGFVWGGWLPAGDGAGGELKEIRAGLESFREEFQKGVAGILTAEEIEQLKKTMGQRQFMPRRFVEPAEGK